MRWEGFSLHVCEAARVAREHFGSCSRSAQLFVLAPSLFCCRRFVVEEVEGRQKCSRYNCTMINKKNAHAATTRSRNARKTLVQGETHPNRSTAALKRKSASAEKSGDYHHGLASDDAGDYDHTNCAANVGHRVSAQHFHYSNASRKLIQ